MTILTVTAEGQVTLRSEVLQHLGVRPGDGVDVEMLPGGRVEVRAASPRGGIADVFGFLKRPGAPALSVEEIGEAAAEEWSGER
jgi:antitoxin PrlF